MRLAPPSTVFVGGGSAVVLDIAQTYLAERGYNNPNALVRLWIGSTFTNLRLRPQNYERAIVVVTRRYGSPVLIQLTTGERSIYLHPEWLRAFKTFKDWIDYACAQERIWSRKEPSSE